MNPRSAASPRSHDKLDGRFQSRLAVDLPGHVGRPQRVAFRQGSGPLARAESECKDVGMNIQHDFIAGPFRPIKHLASAWVDVKQIILKRTDDSCAKVLTVRLNRGGKRPRRNQL